MKKLLYIILVASILFGCSKEQQHPKSLNQLTADVFSGFDVEAVSSDAAIADTTLTNIDILLDSLVYIRNNTQALDSFLTAKGIAARINAFLASERGTLIPDEKRAKFAAAIREVCCKFNVYEQNEDSTIAFQINPLFYPTDMNPLECITGIPNNFVFSVDRDTKMPKSVLFYLPPICSDNDTPNLRIDLMAMESEEAEASIHNFKYIWDADNFWVAQCEDFDITLLLKYPKGIIYFNDANGEEQSITLDLDYLRYQYENICKSVSK